MCMQSCSNNMFFANMSRYSERIGWFLLICYEKSYMSRTTCNPYRFKGDKGKSFENHVHIQWPVINKYMKKNYQNPKVKALTHTKDYITLSDSQCPLLINYLPLSIVPIALVTDISLYTKMCSSNVRGYSRSYF